MCCLCGVEVGWCYVEVGIVGCVYVVDVVVEFGDVYVYFEDVLFWLGDF